jgi:septation ring formation regulator EzrA
MLNTTLKDIENLYNELKILCKKYKNCSDVKQVYDQYKNMQKQMLKRDINMSKLGDLMKRQKQLWLSLPSALDR